MSDYRISRKPAELADQCEMAGTEIPNEVDWPAASPTSIAMLGRNTTIRGYLQQIEQLKAQISDMRGLLKDEVNAARDDMGKVDGTTDVLYGPDSPKKKAYGLRPKETGGGAASGKPEKVVILSMADGVQENSIFCDFTT